MIKRIKKPRVGDDFLLRTDQESPLNYAQVDRNVVLAQMKLDRLYDEIRSLHNKVDRLIKRNP